MTLLAKRLEARSGSSAPAITRSERRDQMSFAQRRLWFLHQLAPEDPSYNIALAVKLIGVLDVPPLNRALNDIWQRHEVLRTTFVMVDGEPVARVSPIAPFELSLIDLGDLTAEREQAAREFAFEEAKLPFDLSEGPLLRGKLLRFEEDVHVILLTMHHIVSDAWSIGVFVSELSELYNGYVRGKPVQLAEPSLQYVDYAVWQSEKLNGVLDRQLSYWKNHLAGMPALLELPADKPRPAVQTFRGSQISFDLPEALVARVKALAAEEDVTSFMTLLAAFQALLARYTGQKEIVVGSPVAGRNRAETERLIGFFVNTLVLRAEVPGESSFRELLKQVKSVCLGAFANQDVPFERLVEELQSERSVSHQPLFQVMFQLHNAARDLPQLHGLAWEWFAREAGEAVKFDLMLSLEEKAGALSGVLSFNSDVFERESVERMARHFVRLVESIVAEPDRELERLPLLSDAERVQLLVEWSGPTTAYPRHRCVHELFEEQAASRAASVALVCDGRELTYGQLNERANQLGYYLRELGVGPEVPVGIFMDRGFEFVIAVLGVLKAGGAYVPIVPHLPAERIAYIARDAGVRVLLTARQETPFDVECLDLQSPEIAKRATENLNVSVTPDNLAYVMYTSGSTGTPKGASVPHRAIVRLVKETNYARLSEAEVFLLLSSVSFDVLTFDLWGSLLNGARLVIMAPESPSLADLDAVIKQHNVTTLWLTAGLFHLAVNERLEALSGVRQLLAGGDVLSVDHVERYLASSAGDAVLINGYGPTENTTFSCTFRMDSGWRARGNSVPIGRPIANSRVYVLDQAFGLAPVGVAGELFVAGDGLARDYLRQPQLTAEKFVPDPHSDVPGARLYRTGDWVRWMADGNLEFIGRIDQQVKIRGFRVELGEIEAALNEHERVREAAVVARSKGVGERQIVAYVVADDVSNMALRMYLKSRLPEYMTPAVFVRLDKLPLMASDKVDRRALPAPSASDLELSEQYVEATAPVQEILAGIWREVLRVERVGIDDDFFALGGHSLKATQVMSRVRQVCAVELPLRSLFTSPTVRGLAQEVESRWRSESETVEVALKPVAREGELPLSFAQQRLWFLDQLEPNSAFYNVPVAIRLRGRLVVTALERSVNEIVRRHEVLRTRFPIRHGEPVQLIDPPQPLSLTVLESEGEITQLVQREMQVPFDLSTGPLLRAQVLRLSAEEHLVLLTMHHIVSDAWSMGIMTRELSALYQAYSSGAEQSPLAELPIQYADFAAWQREWLQGERLEQQLDYWREQLADAATLELPTDHVRPAHRSSAGKVYTFSLDRELREQLKALSQQRGVTMFMTLLAAWQLLLSRYSRQTDIVVGTPIAGRTRGETESLIGFFVNTVVLRTDCGGDPAFVELLERVREVCLGAYAHQEVPFEKLVEELEPVRDLSRSPLFQVLFAMQNVPHEVLELSGLQVSSVALEAETTKFDVALTLTESEQGLKATIEYRTDLYEIATIERMANRLCLLLESIAADPGRRLSQVALLSEAERHQLLVEWNNTRREYEVNKCLHELFEAQVEQTPDLAAVVYEDQRLSYRELNERANQLAHHLRRLDVGPEVLVGLLMERSLEMVVGVMGILKAGGGYVSVDPSYPAERIGLMLEPAPVLVTQQRLTANLPQLSAQVVCLDSDWSAIALENTANPKHQTTSSNIAYVIYTSGSTGTPKGVMIEHRSTLNLLAALDDLVYHKHEPPVRLTMNAPLVFDASVHQLIELVAGHTLYVLPEEVRADPAAFTSFLERHEIELLDCTPSHLRMLLERGLERNQFPKIVLVGGEALDPLWPRLVNSDAFATYNLYGPTECTVDSIGCHVTGDTPTIGKPLANTEVYVLDEQLHPAGIGMVGELYHGGAGLGRGYLNRPELTAARFIPHPFSQTPGARLYRTGDLVKYHPDGTLAFLGRCDHQIKLRGHRLELGEIQSVLMTHPTVRNAAVLVNEAPERLLVAYVILDETTVTSNDLKKYLRNRLPDYMVPAAIVELDQLPLTRNGKLDRARLPAPAFEARQEAFVAPRTPTEEKLARIWSEVLMVERVGVHDNFFDLGGHSLLATRVFSRMQDVFSIELPLRALFEAATVAGLAERVDATCGELPEAAAAAAGSYEEGA